MAKVKCFLSFEYKRDLKLRGSFFQQAQRGDSCHDLEDYSLNEPYRPHNNSWKKKARKLIDLSDIVIVFLGDDTHNAPGVEIEMTFNPQFGGPGLQIRPKPRTSGAVKGAVVVYFGT